MEKEKKPILGWGNMNGISEEDDRTCALNDMNCLETQEEKTRLLKEILYDRFALEAKMYAQQLPEGTKYAESFQWNEYGARLTDELCRAMTE